MSCSYEHTGMVNHHLSLYISENGVERELQTDTWKKKAHTHARAYASLIVAIVVVIIIIITERETLALASSLAYVLAASNDAHDQQEVRTHENNTVGIQVCDLHQRSTPALRAHQYELQHTARKCQQCQQDRPTANPKHGSSLLLRGRLPAFAVKVHVVVLG